MEAKMTKRALVLGANGGIGGSVARRLLSSGWHVRAFTRRSLGETRLPGCELFTGDAMKAADVAAASAGVSLIVHAVNPPGYRNWADLVLPMLGNTIAAAKANRARILLPGTVYNFGPDTLPVIAEDASQHPVTRKGTIRAEMERRLGAAAEAGEIKAMIVRAGDFFGPDTGSSWFSQGVVKPGKRPTRIYNPGRPGVGHQWAYLPDVAETMVRLAETDDLSDFATFQMEGHWDPDGTQMMSAIVRVLRDPAVRIARFPWWAMRLAALFATTPREMLEVKYLWQQPVRLENDRLVARLGKEPHTPLDDAVAATLEAMGCLPFTPTRASPPSPAHQRVRS